MSFLFWFVTWHTHEINVHKFNMDRSSLFVKQQREKLGNSNLLWSFFHFFAKSTLMKEGCSSIANQGSLEDQIKDLLQKTGGISSKVRLIQIEKQKEHANQNTFEGSCCWYFTWVNGDGLESSEGFCWLPPLRIFITGSKFSYHGILNKRKRSVYEVNPFGN